MSKNKDSLFASIGSVSNNQQDALLIPQILKALDENYRLTEKMAQEPGIKDILQQFIGRIE
ncbi:MAG TPA: hypothetical protein VIY29_14665, partial [Ktedonobacteraceae bacterium]